MREVLDIPNGKQCDCVLFYRLFRLTQGLSICPWETFQSTINLEMRFGNKIHPTFNNYLLNFNHSRFLTVYLHEELRFELTGLDCWIRLMGNSDLTYLVLSLTKCYKDRGYQIIQRKRREVWGIKGNWQARSFLCWTRGSGTEDMKVLLSEVRKFPHTAWGGNL